MMHPYDISFGTILWWDSEHLLASHHSIHLMWDAGLRTPLVSVLHAWMVEEMAFRGLVHTYISDLDDSTPTKGDFFSSDRPEPEPHREPDVALPDYLAKALASPVDHGWDHDTLEFSWLPAVRASWDETAAHVSAMDAPGDWGGHWRDEFVRKSLRGEAPPSGLPAWARPPASAVTPGELMLRQIEWAARAADTSAIRKSMGGGRRLARHLLAWGVRPDADVEAEIAKVRWDAKYVNDLPDSAFLHVGPGGFKDASGKTVPRTLRKFPVRDKAGKVDMPHLRNALSRMPQADMPEAARAKAMRMARSMAKAAGMEMSKSMDGGMASDRDIPAMLGGRMGDDGRTGVGRPAHGPMWDMPDVRGAANERYGDFQIVKSLDERRLVTGPVVIPGRADGQRDVFTPEAVEQVAFDFLAKHNKTTALGVQHSLFPPGMRLVESWITKSAWDVGGRTMPEGTWMMTVHVEDDALWSDVKKGLLTGFSIAGKGAGRLLRKAA